MSKNHKAMDVNMNQKEGLNEVFKFINPKEQSSCGCGVSINFDLEQVEVDKSKIFAVEV